MNDLRSVFNRLCGSLISRRAAILIAALAWSSLAFCGEIHDAAQNGDVEKVKALLKDNPDLVSAKDDAGNLPLHLAAMKGRRAVVELLLANQAQVNARGLNDQTPLHFAAAAGHQDMVKWLLA